MYINWHFQNFNPKISQKPVSLMVKTPQLETNEKNLSFGKDEFLFQSALFRALSRFA